MARTSVGQLWFNTSGWTRDYLDCVDLKNADLVIDLHEPRGTLVSGTVVDGRGRPMNNELLDVTLDPDRPVGEANPNDTTTDAQGRFRIYLLPGRYVFTVETDTVQVWKRVKVGSTPIRGVTLKNGAA